ncbi:cupin domain-containing protein [Rhodococcus sp. 06-156-3C]|uniref:(R)-mandelonitrile lyase n=1 Tax=Nocardiaceae TaxID=85025 RepID=UPI000522FD0A|nr:MULTISPECIES: cupin domain-containing protein [Rhodococcus]OZD13062.1 cupin domain-containing protein [Rhodococcus sp. 06-156-4a]OZD17931.1 cupin domain-containing protein [Rhodococcus sp. 06-156-3C]OZD20655.1 cupin domain-containing protein [Rhodococcus sp. 06-156-4C]OZD30627.1 cupin domain-containing protein [Rhodococcus sp. 06-156-3b]OZD32601.1 cupin domain-containing protein [Rhodococcus sp. 06-156-3]
MKLTARQPTAKAPESNFTGNVYVDNVAHGDSPTELRVSTVRFSPCARTNWHCHAHGQTLYVTEGIGRVQARGGELLEIRPGDTIYTPPGEWHWHGAAPDHFMSHLAIKDFPNDQSGPDTTWGDPVTDAEYNAL